MSNALKRLALCLIMCGSPWPAPTHAAESEARHVVQCLTVSAGLFALPSQKSIDPSRAFQLQSYWLGRLEALKKKTDLSDEMGRLVDDASVAGLDSLAAQCVKEYDDVSLAPLFLSIHLATYSAFPLQFPTDSHVTAHHYVKPSGDRLESDIAEIDRDLATHKITEQEAAHWKRLVMKDEDWREYVQSLYVVLHPDQDYCAAPTSGLTSTTVCRGRP